MGVKIKWYGREYTQKLYRHVDQKMKGVAQRIQVKAKSEVPVLTGELKQSIEVRKIKAMEYAVGSSLKYAMAVEMGSSRQSPKPYLRPAINSVRGL